MQFPKIVRDSDLAEYFEASTSAALLVRLASAINVQTENLVGEMKNRQSHSLDAEVSGKARAAIRELLALEWSESLLAKAMTPEEFVDALDCLYSDHDLSFPVNGLAPLKFRSLCSFMRHFFRMPMGFCNPTLSVFCGDCKIH